MMLPVLARKNLFIFSKRGEEGGKEEGRLRSDVKTSKDSPTPAQNQPLPIIISSQVDMKHLNIIIFAWHIDINSVYSSFSSNSFKYIIK